MINKKKADKSVFLDFVETMTRYFIELSFKGTHYHGWQSQPNAISVQSEIEKALKVLLHEEIKITGAGRTDTGVHASHYAAHFDVDDHMVKVDEQLVYHMNAVLPPDIAIQKVYQVNPTAHARFSAISRTYQYRISRVKDPFMTEYAWYYSLPLNTDVMNECAGLLPKFNDFTSFSKLHTDTKTNDCQVIRAEWITENGYILFTITANRFLRNMVRSLVGTMINAGRNKISTDGFREIIEARNRCKAGFSAPAHGLILQHIQYADNIRL